MKLELDTGKESTIYFEIDWSDGERGRSGLTAELGGLLNVGGGAGKLRQRRGGVFCRGWRENQAWAS
jgi:hypothetical protein